MVSCGACVWRPVSYDNAAREATENAVAAFEQSGELERYFAEAAGYAVFPAALRAGTGFGGAFGNGWLFEGGELTGRVVLLEFFAGVDLGAQGYRSILFFRSEEALQQFRSGRLEFTGQASVAAITAGKAITPAYSRDVALFVQVRGGLMLEASVGAQRYDYFPLVGAPGQ
jgi:lipid-binding SYLF domain-containing protein